MRSQNDSTREVSNLVNIGDATFCFSVHNFWEKRNAQHFVQLEGLSARAGSRWPPRARKSHQTVDRPRPRFNGDEHSDPSLRYHNRAQDTCVRNAPHDVSVEL